jgi:acetyl/propionyl-CoA carboxylase alpha subunit
MNCLSIRKILIANRGEIAVRIARTAREMGISPVAVYTDADRGAPHLRAGDESVAIGASYLDIDRILDAARKTIADAIHPGYGFLAENADFADACHNAGIMFIGPSADAIRKMGSKIAARKIAAAAGVPVVPAIDPIAAIQFPALVKASAGGGGRGMRIVKSAEQLDESLQSAKSEAERAFGDGTLLIERYIENARHIEFQIFGDQHGNLIHLFERDCSIQRRHQKIIEESPSPALNPDLRRRMGEAAVAIGRAIGYTNAGTVEFLLAPSGEFFFIEANTRIQVEHPVTELITGLDLVRLQIEVAEGKPLTVNQSATGHAIEARLYAEDPRDNFVPSTGTVHVWRPPQYVRVDTALEEGAQIGIHYDSLLAKIVSHGDDRESALRKLVDALRSTCILGLQTNRDYLIQILEREEFREGRATTAFLPTPRPEVIDPGCLAAAVLHVARSPLKGIPPNYRNNPYRDASIKLRIHNGDITVNVAQTFSSVSILARTDNQITLAADGITRSYRIKVAGDEIFVHSPTASLAITRLPRHPRPASATQRETANSPMPGQVLRVLVREGQQVKTGDSLVVLEAMKMEQTIRTTIDGVVKSILVVTGQVVAPGQMLVQISAQENRNE